MEYAYVICPKCWDRLVEIEKKEDLNIYEQKRCLNCGSRFGLALLGERKIDNAIYKVIIKNKWGLDEKRVAIIRKDLKRAHFDADAIIKAITAGKKGNTIYKGDAMHIYLFECVFSGFESWIEFNIVPKFPYKIFHPEYFLCPECGAEVISRTEPYDSIKGWFIDGLYCNNCNKWTLGPTVICDNTIYTLKFSSNKLKRMEDCSLKRGIMKQLNKIPNKKIQGDQMSVYINSEKILEIVPYLRSMDFAYEIEPPFPHRIE